MDSPTTLVTAIPTGAQAHIPKVFHYISLTVYVACVLVQIPQQPDEEKSMDDKREINCSMGAAFLLYYRLKPPLLTCYFR